MSIEECRLNEQNRISNVVLVNEANYTAKNNDKLIFVSGGCTVTLTDLNCFLIEVIAKDDASTNNVIVKDSEGNVLHTINTNKGKVKIIRDIADDYTII